MIGEGKRGGARPGSGRPKGGNPAKSSLVVLRVEPARKSAWVRAAGGQTLAAWIIQNCDGGLK